MWNAICVFAAMVSLAIMSHPEAAKVKEFEMRHLNIKWKRSREIYIDYRLARSY